MSCTPGERSATNVRIGRKRLVTNLPPGRGKSRCSAPRVCAGLSHSVASADDTANMSATWLPSTSVMRTSSPARTVTQPPV